MRTKNEITEQDEVNAGMRCSDVELDAEADVVQGLQEKFVEQLTPYGYGRIKAAELAGLREDRKKMRLLRQEGVVAKQQAIGGLNDLFDETWSLLEQMHVLLTPFARRSGEFAARLRTFMPGDHLDLGKSYDGISALFAEKAPEMSPDVPTADLLARGGDLRKRLDRIFTSKAQAKDGAKAETRELDRLDGRLYLWIADFYAAGRAAIRAGRIDAPLSDFRFRFCARPDRKKAAKPDAPTA